MVHLKWVLLVSLHETYLRFSILEPKLIFYFYNYLEMQKQQKNGNFVQKLEKLLKSQAFSEIICWDSSKTIIDVLDVKRMEAQIIPKFFRHQKFESFVRQLNLYGFRKIKLQGRHRFTHPLLLSGQQLASIISLKSLKNDKGSRETVQSPGLQENRPLFPQVNRISLNLMENVRQAQPLNQQTNFIMQLDSNDVQRLSGNNVFMMPGNYFNFWNFTPFMGSNIPSLPIMAPFIPQK